MSTITYFILVLLFAKVKSNISIVNEFYDLNNDFACQIAVANDARITIVYSDDSDSELLRCLSELSVPVFTIKSIGVPQNRSCTTTQILTIARDTRKRLQQIDIQLEWVTINKKLSKYVLIFKEPCEEFLEETFKLFWKHWFANVIALCRSSTTTNQHVYTFEPFTETGFKVVRLLKTSELFYDKLKNLHQYKLKVSQFYDPIRSIPLPNQSGFRGVDGILGQTIVEQLNATMELIEPPNDELYGSETNGVLNGALKYVATGATNVSWNIRYLVLSQAKYYEYLYPIGKRFFLHLVVPKATTVPQYSNFIRVFENLTWWLLLLNFVLVVVVFAIFQKLALRLPNANRNAKIQFWNVLDMFFKTAIGNPIDGFHRYSPLRQFLISWILFCYIIGSIYVAKMESVFINPEFENDIDSLSELGQLKAPIYSHANFLKVLKPAINSQLYETIISKHRFLPQNYEAHIQTMTSSSSNRFAFLLRRERAAALISRTYDSDAKRPKYHLVKEYLISMPMTYIVTKGSPFVEKFERLVMRFYEHGLYKHWEVIARSEEIDTEQPISRPEGDDYYDTNEMDYDDSEDDDVSERNAIVLTMDILQGAFYLWLIGIGIACLGFLLELSYWKWTGQRNKIKPSAVMAE